MRKVALAILMAGVAMNAYGTEIEDRLSRNSRQPLAPLSDQSNTDPYPECSQHIKEEKEQARLRGIEKGKLRAMTAVAIKMFRKAGTYTADITELTGITEEQLREALAKEEHK